MRYEAQIETSMVGQAKGSDSGSAPILRFLRH